MPKTNKSKQAQQGIGLLELMLSVAIIALLLIVATRYFVVVRTTQQTTNAISMVEGVRAAAGNYSVGQTNNYANITMVALNNQGLLPKDLVGTAATPGQGVNPWGGNLQVAPSSDGGQVIITLTQVPQANCEGIVNALNNQAETISPAVGGCAAAPQNVIVTFN